MKVLLLNYILFNLNDYKLYYVQYGLKGIIIH
jgi:hypothetical protein